MLILKILYNILIYSLIPIALPIGYIFAYKRGEQSSYFERFGFIKLKKSEYTKSVWFHCASVGEVRSIKPLVNEVRKKYPDYAVICSTITATGKEMAETYLKPDEVFLLPIENSIAIKYLINTLNTKVLFIVDTELWPNLISAASNSTKLCLINGRLSEKSFNRYKRLSFIFRSLLKKFSKIFTKSEADLQKFSNLLGSNKNIFNMGNIKFFEQSSVVLPEILESLQNKKVFTAGSTHEGEELVVIRAYKECRASFDMLFIAPRHINRADAVVTEAEKEGLSAKKFSQLYPNDLVEVVVVDAMGLLELLYSVSDKIFIGGSFVNIGGHNIFEALQFKKVIAAGKFIHNFKEISDIALQYRLLYIINDELDLVKYLKSTEGVEYNFNGFFCELNKLNKNKTDLILKEIPNEK